MTIEIIIIAVSVLWLGSEIILSRRNRSLSTDRHFDKSSLRVLWVSISLGVSCGVVLGFQRIGYFGKGSPFYPIAGLVIILGGMVVRWIAILSLKQQFTVDVAIRKDHRIVRDGIYRRLRHPAYAGILLSFFGLGLFFANYLSILVIIVPICSAFLYRIHVEEKTLSTVFGDEYLIYCRSTKRLIPGVF